MVRTSLSLPFKRIAEVREMTLSALTPARSEMISSVRPSLKDSSPESGLRLTNGRTTRPLARDWAVLPVAVVAQVAPEGVERLRANSAAVAGRSAGSEDITRCTAPLRWTPISGRLVAGAGGGSVSRRAMVRCGEPPGDRGPAE